MYFFGADILPKKCRKKLHILKGKTAIVTVGTRGIGFAIVKVFLKNGAKAALFGSCKETVDKAECHRPDIIVTCHPAGAA